MGVGSRKSNDRRMSGLELERQRQCTHQWYWGGRMLLLGDGFKYRYTLLSGSVGERGSCLYGGYFNPRALLGISKHRFNMHAWGRALDRRSRNIGCVPRREAVKPPARRRPRRRCRLVVRRVQVTLRSTLHTLHDCLHCHRTAQASILADTKVDTRHHAAAENRKTGSRASDGLGGEEKVRLVSGHDPVERELLARVRMQDEKVVVIAASSRRNGNGLAQALVPLACHHRHVQRRITPQQSLRIQA
mmetsp:Transcript_43136/g.107972  ORF Transcript_43136/g.107972 Transcript_43136/m.107972 type:complete len:246 (+) Transcript_43136:2578-3315(+)